MKLNTARLVGVGLLAASGLGAQAATITLATPGNTNATFASATTLSFNDAAINSSTTATKTFFDDFVFTIGTGMNLNLTTVLPVSITGLTESLYATTTNIYTSVTNPGLTSLVTPTTATTWNNLAAGTYTLQFSGVANKATTLLGVTVPAGAYTSVINLTPVPETETYAMLLAGLGLIGTVIRRKKMQA
jgi:hypothetical protein